MSDKLVTIDEVDQGLACDCVCPQCKSPLIARKGDKREHHFAHYKVNDCGWRGESYWHLLAKDIIAASESIILPALCWDGRTDIEIYGEYNLKIDNVKLEKKLDAIIPDIIIESKGRRLLVEINYSHRIDYEKYLKIKALNIPTIEIDIRHIVSNLLLGRDFYFRDKSFKNALLADATHSYWVHNPENERISQVLKMRYADKLKVNHLLSKNWQFDDAFLVNDCPFRLHVYKSGLMKGEVFANRENDCKKCAYYLGAGISDYYDPVADNTTPNTQVVYCVGYLSEPYDMPFVKAIDTCKKRISLD